MKNERDSSPSQKLDEKNQKKRLMLLSSLVVFLTLIVFAMGVALVFLFINERKLERAQVNETSKASSEVIAAGDASRIATPSPVQEITPLQQDTTPSPKATITPSPAEIITPSPEANTTLTPQANITPPTPEVTTLASPQSASVSNKSFEYQGLLFELQKCEKLNINVQTQSIRCSVAIISTQENVKIELYSALRGNEDRRSRILDAGQESIAEKIQFGSDVTRWGRTSNNLIKDVPIKAIFMFENVPLETDEIDVFEITSTLKSSYYNNDIKVEFRNVNVSGS
ncbi:hypothetical protein [Mastigocoleus testarum]|uniref:Uncharacterized protein n=1 Tax=Mastigocoleus testarum BC008 TaxID=371196 RepID=A0A0V7ZDC2_9CYAN|nr:hypothetical protein [Mastigocoleus testarum]KST62471.1 hypothetical protein BC008_09895 [Mastigocoleus testarum BC008]